MRLNHYVRVLLQRPLWQSMFLISATTWLAAPYINTVLYPKTAMISDYKMPGQPYFWLFSIGDVVAGLLVLVAAWYMRKQSPLIARVWWALLPIGILMIIDSLAPVTCHIQAGQCVRYWSSSLIVHGIESVSLGILIFVASAWHAYRRKSMPSLAFVLVQAANAFLFIITWGNGGDYATLMQYAYQLLTAVWLAYWIGEYLPEPQNTHIFASVRAAVAIWAYANGILAIGYGILPHRFVTAVDTLYFAGDTAWLAQHNVLTGLVMLYFSRQLWRGEHRARHILLGVLFLEVLKFSVVTPRPFLAVIYGLSFVALFSLKDFYQRGSERLDWHVRLKEIMTVLVGICAALLMPAILYIRDPGFARVVRAALGKLYAFYIGGREHMPAGSLKSELIAHTLTALSSGLIVIVLWTLFKPAGHTKRRNIQDRDDALSVLMTSSCSSEDYFKCWPNDKYYYWNQERSGFVAYKIAGSVVYALADPIASDTKAQRQLLEEFLGFCQKHGYTCCFLVVHQASLALYTDAGFKSMHIGSNAVANVQAFAERTIRTKWWRWQLNRSQKQGYCYERVLPPHSAQLLKQTRSVSDAWSTRPGHREQGFAMGYYDDEYLQRCVLHIVRDASGELIAFANQLPVFNGLSQQTVDLMRFNPSANNSMQFLLASMIRELYEAQSASSFDLGFVPLAQTNSHIARIVKLIGRSRFSAAGLEQFKNKFEPTWHNNYIVYSGDIADLAIVALHLEEVMRLSDSTA